MRTILAFALLGMIAAGCDQGAELKLDGYYRVEVRTDKSDYAQGDSVHVSVQNLGSQTVLSDIGCGWTLALSEGKGWRNLDGAVCIAIPRQPVPILPGETVWFRAALNYGSGVYRYTFPLSQSSGGFALLPDDERSSNVFSINPGSPRAPDYIVFGRYYGECYGEHCREMFKIEYGLLQENTLDQYPVGLYTGSYILLNAEKYNSVRSVRNSIPDDVFTLPDGRIGEPDAHDQGGVYLELEKNGRRHFWLIDTIKPRIPGFLHPVVDTVLNAVRRLQ